MNSIAAMPKKTTPPAAPSKQALAFAGALRDAAISDAKLAAKLEVSPGLIYQWKKGIRPVPQHHAEAVGRELGVDPARISEDYASFLTAASNIVPMPRSSGGDERRHDLIIARLENDIDSLRFAMAALVSTMTIHRPAEAADVAKTIRKKVPQKFVRQGYLHELLQALDKG